MDPLVLAPWRDLALILLILYAVIVVAVPGVALYFALKGIRALKRLIRPPLAQAQMWARRIQNGTVKATDSVAAVPIRMHVAATRANVTARGIFDFMMGR